MNETSDINQGEANTQQQNRRLNNLVAYEMSNDVSAADLTPMNRGGGTLSNLIKITTTNNNNQGSNYQSMISSDEGGIGERKRETKQVAKMSRFSGM